MALFLEEEFRCNVSRKRSIIKAALGISNSGNTNTRLVGVAAPSTSNEILEELRIRASARRVDNFTFDAFTKFLIDRVP